MEVNTLANGHDLRVTTNDESHSDIRIVIPAVLLAGIQKIAWIPASAGMTQRTFIQTAMIFLPQRRMKCRARSPNEPKAVRSGNGPYISIQTAMICRSQPRMKVTRSSYRHSRRLLAGIQREPADSYKQIIPPAFVYPKIMTRGKKMDTPM